MHTGIHRKSLRLHRHNIELHTLFKVVCNALQQILAVRLHKNLIKSTQQQKNLGNEQ